MSDPAEVPTASPLLETVGLACERDWRMLFERLDLRLAAGEMLQVVGPNGSGKTSLLRLLSGLMQPTAGEVRLNGRPLAEQRGELARSLLWIGHAAGIKGLLSAEENLTWLCALHQPASREAIWQALADVGLRGFEDVPCHTLSAGQQRRVALARALLVRPRLLLLDEPFTGLDAGLRRELVDLVREAQRARRLTTVFVTHEEEDAARIADSTARFYDTAGTRSFRQEPSQRF